MKRHIDRLTKSSLFLVTVGIFIVVTIFVSGLSLRVDFSRNNAHTLSNSSKKIITELDDVVTLTFYVSSDIPVRLLTRKQEVLDLLDEYKKQSKDKITVKVADPKKDTQALSRAQSLGIPQLQFSQVEKDSLAVATSFFGIGVGFEDKTEIIPQVVEADNLEYDLTAALFKLTRKNPIRVGIAGMREFVSPQEDEFRTVKEVLRQQFDLKFFGEFSASGEGKLDESIKTLLIVDEGDKNYSTQSAFIKEYLAQKGTLIGLLGGMSVGPDMLPHPANHGLFDLLKAYGLTLNADFVLSQSSEIASFSNGEMSFFVPYPFWVSTTQLERSESLLTRIDSLLFPWTSSIDTAKKDSLTLSTLVRSSKSSWNIKDVVSLSPETISPPDKKDMKEFVLAAEAVHKDGGRILLIPSPSFIKEQFIARQQGNLSLLINAVNHFASGGALSGIRARTSSRMPLIETSSSMKDLVKYGNMILLPGIFLIFGVIRLSRRK